MRRPCVCVLFVYSWSVIVFNQSAGVITDHSRSTKDIDPYYKSQFCRGSCPLKAGTHFTEWAEQTRRASARNKVRTNNLLIDSLTSYR